MNDYAVEKSAMSNFYDQVGMDVWDCRSEQAPTQPTAVERLRSATLRSACPPKRPKRIAKKIAKRYGYQTFSAARASRSMDLLDVALWTLSGRMVPFCAKVASEPDQRPKP